MYTKIIFLILIIFLTSCNDEKVAQENKKVKIAIFSADSSYQFIQDQVDFGKRYMNTQEHEDCKDWLVEKLKSYDFEVTEQKFEATSYQDEILDGTNIIGQYNSKIKERLLLCAHYDTRHIADKDTIDQNKPIDGADDGASGVGVLLEIARQLKNNPIPMGVDIIFFDAEDYGDPKGDMYSWALGSQYWVKHIHEKPYVVKYGILLDMVGSKNATFPKEGFSMKTASNQVNKIWKFAHEMGYSEYFVNDHIDPVVDDHTFIVKNTNIPMIDVINHNGVDFGNYHHTHADNMDLIDKETLKAVGQIILGTVYKESNKENF